MEEKVSKMKGKLEKRHSYEKAMSVPHDEPQKVVSEKAENWLDNARKQLIPNKVDWSTSAVNGSHIWLDTEAHGCHIQDCKKSGSRKKCASCKIVVHEKCIHQLERINSCKCRPTFVEGSVLKVPYPQHHVAHRRKQEGKCDQCGKYFQSMLSFQSARDMIAVNCSWCKKAVHNKPECSKDMYMDEKCMLGMHSRLIVPPSWIVKLPPRKCSTTPTGKQRRTTRRRSSRERRAFLIKPIEGSEEKIPIIVFVNPKSGGNQGAKIMERFQWLLNPRQVFDLMADGGPRFGLELYRKIPNLRILVCGGDGSAGWVLSEIDHLKMNPTPPVAILPLGTGNDLSRFLGWGSGYTDEPLSRVLTQIEEGVVEKLDRWNLDVRTNPKREGCERSEDANNKLPLNVMNNYFSLGADADVCLEFHESREANPNKFTSRFRNLVFYGKAGGRQVLQSKFKDLHKSVDQLICDGRDLTYRIHELKPVCILFLNISKYSAGTSPWGHPTSEHFLPQSCNDGYLEIIGFTSTSMVANQCGGHGVRIDQCSQAILCTNRCITMQVDGEPCRLNPSRIHLKRRNQSNMIFKKRHQRLYACEEESEVVNSQKANLKINYLTFPQYEQLSRYDVNELKSIAQHICNVPDVDLETSLDQFRLKIEEIKTTEDSLQSRLSNQWCFLDATWPARIYRIDEAQENLMLIEDIIEDGIHVLDLARSDLASDDAFQVCSPRGSSPWRDPNKLNTYRGRASPARRVSSPTLYELESLSSKMELIGQGNFGIEEKCHNDDNHVNNDDDDDEDDSSDSSDNDQSDSNQDDDNEDEDEASSNECSPRVPLSPHSKSNEMPFTSVSDIPEMSTESRRKMFLQAARKGDLEQFTALHQADASLVWCDSRGYTSLHLAAKHGRKNVAEYILQNVQQCVLDLVDNDRCQTPLHKAALYRRRTICKMLVNAGASLTRRDLEGNTPRALALRSHDGELATFLENQERLQIIASDDHETAV